MARAVILVLDSVGIGAAPDAAAYGDQGADTLGHIAEACAGGRADREGLRRGPLRVPNLAALGLGSAARLATGRLAPGLELAPPPASWGVGIERSAGKDTPSGHWEIAGTPAAAWGTFRRAEPCFPPDLVAALVAEGGLPGILGDRHDSGTAIVEALGEEHLRTGRPICYTSVDSVFQIAAHEESFGLQRLYDLCRIARRLCDPLNVGRVIARPFAGRDRASFHRTANRKDFALLPPDGTVLQRATEAGRSVVSIGKIGDIFAHAYTGEEVNGAGNAENIDLTVAALDGLPPGGLLFSNLVDFDSVFGHRRDVPGYAACLERFDARLPEILHRLRPDDLLVVTADHGNDPTFSGTDHTRETVPILNVCAGRPLAPIGRRDSFADIGATVASHLGLPPPPFGRSWL